MPRVTVRILCHFLRYRPGDIVAVSPLEAKVMVARGVAAYEKSMDRPPADKMSRGFKIK